MKYIGRSTRTKLATSTTAQTFSPRLSNFEPDQNEEDCWMEEEPLISETENVNCHVLNYQYFISKQNIEGFSNKYFFIQLKLLQIFEDIGAAL